MRLACPCGTVCENCRVESIEHSFDQKLGSQVEDLDSVDVLIESVVKCILLFPGPILAKLVLAVLFGKVFGILQ